RRTMMSPCPHTLFWRLSPNGSVDVSTAAEVSNVAPAKPRVESPAVAYSRTRKGHLQSGQGRGHRTRPLGARMAPAPAVGVGWLHDGARMTVENGGRDDGPPGDRIPDWLMRQDERAARSIRNMGK